MRRRGWTSRWPRRLLATVDPAAPLGDLTPLRRAIGDAEIVGLGESTHGAAEEETLKHRTLRLLIERMGFRSVAGWSAPSGPVASPTAAPAP